MLAYCVVPKELWEIADKAKTLDAFVTLHKCYRKLMKRTAVPGSIIIAILLEEPLEDDTERRRNVEDWDSITKVGACLGLDERGETAWDMDYGMWGYIKIRNEATQNTA